MVYRASSRQPSCWVQILAPSFLVCAQLFCAPAFSSVNRAVTDSAQSIVPFKHICYHTCYFSKVLMSGQVPRAGAGIQRRYAVLLQPDILPEAGVQSLLKPKKILSPNPSLIPKGQNLSKIILQGREEQELT